ncbi:hypothetical protein EXW52_28165 (plasmid) [Bacillus mycoides]|nr:hypothetical protein EXW52_28165 [Bacillus mycoides]
MQVLSDSSTGTGDGSTTGTQDCAVTGGKGNYIDSGSTNIQGIPVNWIVHECQIEMKVAGQRSVILNRTSTSVSGTINLSYVARVNLIILTKKTPSSRNVKGHSPVSGRGMNWLRTRDGMKSSKLFDICKVLLDNLS